jgi:hypothetical protein
MTTNLRALCAVPLVLLGGSVLPVSGCGPGEPQGPCGMSVVMSCTGTEFCHEYYGQAPTDTIRSACVQLGWVVSTDRCGSEFPDCCIQQDGTEGYPEGVCAPRGAWTGGSLTCTSPGKTLCTR